MATASVPIGSVTGIESLITFGLQVFLAIFGALRHPTTPLPVSAVPQAVTAMQATPGITADHQVVLAAQANAAVAAHQAG